MRKRRKCLTVRESIEVRALAKYTTYSNKRIAALFNVSTSAISNCVQGHTYRDDPGYIAPPPKVPIDKQLVAELFAKGLSYRQIADEVNNRCNSDYSFQYIGQVIRSL